MKQLLLVILFGALLFHTARAQDVLWTRHLDVNPNDCNVRWVPGAALDSNCIGGPLLVNRNGSYWLNPESGDQTVCNETVPNYSSGDQYAVFDSNNIRVFKDVTTGIKIRVPHRFYYGSPILSPDASYWIEYDYSDGGGCGPSFSDFLYERVGDTSSRHTLLIGDRFYNYLTISADGSRLIGWDGRQIALMDPRTFAVLDTLTLTSYGGVPYYSSLRNTFYALDRGIYWDSLPTLLGVALSSVHQRASQQVRLPYLLSYSVRLLMQSGSLLVGDDSTLIAIDPSTLRVRSIYHPSTRFVSYAISPDGSTIVGTRSDSTIVGARVRLAPISKVEAASVLSQPTSVYPNPCSDRATVSFSLDEASDISIEIVDGTGNVLHSIRQAHAVRGVNSLVITTSGLPAGAYFIRISSRTSSGKERVAICAMSVAKM